MLPWIEVPPLGIRVPSYAAFNLLGILVAVTVGPSWIRSLAQVRGGREGWAILLLAMAALVGARLHFVLAHLSLFADRPLDALRIWSPGRHAPGAIAALAIAAPLVAAVCRLPAGRFADAGVPITCVAIAIARLGCFFHGCCVGTRCEWSWCVSLPRTSGVFFVHRAAGLVGEGAAATAPVHPLSLYFAATALLIGLVALWLHPRKRHDWQVVLAAVLVFALSNAALESLRADFQGRAYWGAFPELQWTALGTAGVSAAAMVAGVLRSGR